MRFNNKELIAVAAQPSYKFDKEGVLLLREKQEGLFRRSDVFQEKWFRLRGNLLFYYKNKDQYSEPAGVIVLEDCSVTLDSSTEVPFSFTLVFDGDENGQQLAAFSENERELWIQALHMASYEFMRSQLLSLKEKLETKITQARLCSKERAKTLQCDGIEDMNDRSEPLVDEPNLELCLACDNLQCDADGQPPNPVVYIYTLTPPSVEWTKFAHTEVVQKCSNPTFSTTVGFLKSQIHMSTRVKLSVYHVRERVTATRILLGESVFTVGTLLQIKNSFMRLTLISPDCRSMGFISVMACELKSEAPAAFMNSRQTKSASPQDGSIWLKIDRPRSYSLPSCLSSRANCPLYAYLKILYHNLCSQTYRFHTGLGAEVRVHEIMAEPRLTFLVPQLLLNLWIKEEQKLVDVLLNLGQLRPEWHNNHAMAVDRHLQLINRYRESLEAILNKKNCYLKKSSQKAELLLDFVPVNLHLQRLWAQNVTTRKTGVHDMITVGAFTAYSHDYKHGGLLRLLTQLKTTFPICNNGMPTGVLGPDPLSRAVEAIIRVEQLQSDMEVDLQQMLHFCSQRSASDMQTVVNSLSSKAKQLTLVCSAGLVEEALLAWEEVRPPEMVAPPRQNLAPLSNMFGALGQSLDNVEKSLYTNENILNGSTKIEQFDDQKKIRKFEEGSIPIRKCVTNSPDHICKTSLADCLPSPVGSPEEFEPLDLTHLNIKASIMCMSSKIQNLTLQQQQHPNVQNCWVAELVPSVRKLRQAMQGLCRSAKLTYGLLALKELPQHSTISQEIRHRRDAVFSQALTSVVTGIMTLLWCRPPDPFLLEQIIAAGLLIEFEGLLSCYGDNTGMLEDFVVAIDDLNRTNFWLESSTSKLPQPRVEGNRLFLSVVIPAPEPLMSMLSDAYSKSCRFTASCMLFNIGINEKATLAEKFGDVSLQEKINSNSLNHLREYFRRVSRCSMNSKMGKINASSVSNLLDKLQMEINSKKCKNVEILHLAAEICRRLGGIRFTSCKSAKDRTAMSVTLEQAIFLQKCFHLNNKEMLRALECMRSEGTRRDNTFKNVGVRKYAFNGLQLMALPKMYRPPIGTYGNVQT